MTAGMVAARSSRQGSVRRRLGAALVLGNLLAACGGSSSDTAASQEPSWVVLGSSTAAGVGASNAQSWAALLAGTARGYGAALLNLARAGAVTYNALPAAAARPAQRPATDPAMDIASALARRPRLLVLAFPSNDTLLGYAASETVTNLQTMRDLALAASVPVLLLSSQPRDDASSTQRSVMADIDKTIAATAGSCFVDVSAALTGAGGGIAPAYSAGDGVHLNDAGHRLVFDAIARLLAGGRCVRLAAA